MEHHVWWPLTRALFVSHCTVLQAPVLLRNLSDHSVNVSSSVTLHCPARGIPHPRITWYKDRRKLQQVSGETRKCTFWVLIWRIMYMIILHTCFFHWQELCCFLRKELYILTELQLKTRDFIPVRPPMRGGLWGAPPTFGFKVSYGFDRSKFTLIILRNNCSSKTRNSFFTFLI